MKLLEQLVLALCWKLDVVRLASQDIDESPEGLVKSAEFLE